jgi:hypothetical protein
MKKKVILVVGILMPSPSPPGKIALQYADILKYDCDVSIIFLRSLGNKFNGEMIAGIKYFTVSGFRFRAENYFLKRKKPLIVQLFKAFGRIQQLFSVNGNLAWFYKKAYQKLNEISKTEHIDVIFSVCNPFQAHLAATQFKNENPTTRFVTYTVDPFSKGNQFKRAKLKKALKLEGDVYETADYNFVSEEIFSTEQEKLKNVLHKTEILPYTLINLQREVNENYFDESKINLVYAGNFYKDIRNPEFMLETIHNLHDDRIVLHLYSGGQCQEIIDKYVKKSEGRILKHSLVLLDEMINIMNSCDFLVNVSNNVKEFQPSKTFEYVAIGKPIINFFEKDNLDKVLKKYPLCIQVSTEVLKTNEIKIFIKNNYGKKLDFAVVEEIYSKHAYSAIKEKLVKAIV